MEGGGGVTDEGSLGKTEGTKLELITEGGIKDDMLGLGLDGGITGLEPGGWDDKELPDSSEDSGDVVGGLFGGLEIELGSTGGLDVRVKEDGENVKLKELDKSVVVSQGSLSERMVDEGKEIGGNEVRNDSVGIGVVPDPRIDDDSSLLVAVEGVGLEPGLGTTPDCEVAERSTVLEITPRKELEDGGFSDIGPGVLDVDGGS